jgi:hypothetical protein
LYQNIRSWRDKTKPNEVGGGWVESWWVV